VVEMQEVHVFNTKAYSTYPPTPIVQQPLVWLKQMIVRPIQLQQGKSSLAMRVLGTSHVGVSDPKRLHWTSRAIFTTMFLRRFQLKFVSRLVRAFD
jgi:hypothetical protein